MLDKITALFEPAILALITLVVGMVAAAIKEARPLVIAWVRSKLSVNQQAVIAKISKEAMAFAETLELDKLGKEKLNAAVDHAVYELALRGISVSRNKIIGTVQAAWMDYNKPEAVTLAPNAVTGTKSKTVKNVTS